MLLLSRGFGILFLFPVLSGGVEEGRGVNGDDNLESFNSFLSPSCDGSRALAMHNRPSFVVPRVTAVASAGRRGSHGRPAREADNTLWGTALYPFGAGLELGARRMETNTTAQMNAVLGIIVSTLTRSATSRGGLGGGLDPSTSRCFSPPPAPHGLPFEIQSIAEPFWFWCDVRSTRLFLARRSPS